MKNCPYCKAEIQENARFCLYCMHSLDEKQVIASPPKRKLFLLIAGVAVVTAVLVLLLTRCMSGEDPPQETEQTGPLDSVTEGAPTTEEPAQDETGTSGESLSTQTELPVLPSEGTTEDISDQTGLVQQGSVQPQPTEPTTQKPTRPQPTEPPTQQLTQPQPQPTEPTTQKPTQPQPTEPTTQKPTQPQPTEPTTQKPAQPQPTEPTAQKPAQTEPTVSVAPPCSHQYQITASSPATCTAEGSDTYTCSLCGSSYQETVPVTDHDYQDATCLLPQVCRDCGATGAEALGHGYQGGTCIRCGKADPSDPRMVYEYREARSGDQLPPGSWDSETDIVITGIKIISPDGVYEIPSYIDGKRVIAIRPLAFSGTDARKVTLGENVIYVSQNAFSGCYNIAALYIRSNALFLSRSAFIPASNRSCTMNIYCSAQCVVDDDLYGDCCLKDIVRVYGGVYHEWNG